MVKRTFRGEFDALVPTIGVAELLAEACRDVPICAAAREGMVALERQWETACAAERKATEAEGEVRELRIDWRRVQALRAEAQDLRKKADRVPGRGPARQLDAAAEAKEAQAAEGEGKIAAAIRDIAELQARAKMLRDHWTQQVADFVRRHLAPAADTLVTRGTGTAFAEAAQAEGLARFHRGEAGEIAHAELVKQLEAAVRGS